ncbi:hypothetical protein OIU84_021164 [Salix udensis]|uniref:Uncharacterized protein n=1 Tax=Salix udensis TaxID=889485 RepID=A0AAD6KUF3_9ROSI|nr:hypothetical protein OIU84_021164 [Salix udensis]
MAPVKSLLWATSDQWQLERLVQWQNIILSDAFSGKTESLLLQVLQRSSIEYTQREGIGSSGSGWMSPGEDSAAFASIAEPLLTLISEKAVCTPNNATEILQSLSRSVTEAKDLVNKCQRGTSSNSESELKSSMSHLERVIKEMGACLTLIPSSTFQDQKYAEVAVQALSNEMLSANFEVGQSQGLQTKKLDPHKSFSEEARNEESLTIESDLYPASAEVSTDNSRVLKHSRLCRIPGTQKSLQAKETHQQ